MTYSFDERPDSRQSSSRDLTESREYVCVGETNNATVEAIAALNTPGIVNTAWGVLYRNDIRVRDGGYDVKYASVSYSKNKRDRVVPRFNAD